MTVERVVKRLIFLAVIAFVGGVSAGPLAGLYEDVYPSDAAKREALDMCFMQDHKFNRLEAAERDACYRRTLLPQSADAGIAADMADRVAPNAVDLWRAAGAGSLPRNDVRRHQQTDTALHTSH